MKKVKKFLLGLSISAILLSSRIAYAATEIGVDIKNFEKFKYLIIGIGIVLILLVLFISYKADKNQENDFIEEDDEDDNKNNNEYDDIETDDEQSLYSSFTSTGNEYSETPQEEINSAPEQYKTDSYIKEDTDDFKFDEIFNEQLPNIENNMTQENDMFNDTEDFSSFTTSTDGNEAISLEEDFLMQMNQNFAQRDETNLEDFSVNEEKSQSEEIEVEKIENIAPPQGIEEEQEPPKKTTRRRTKKTVEESETEEPKKTRTRKTAKTTKEEPEEKETKKTTKRTTKKAKEESETEEPKKARTRKTTKIETEQPEETKIKKTTRKTTKKVKEESETQEPKKTRTRTTSKKTTEEEPKQTTTKRTTRKKKEE